MNPGGQIQSPSPSWHTPPLRHSGQSLSQWGPHFLPGQAADRHTFLYNWHCLVCVSASGLFLLHWDTSQDSSKRFVREEDHAVKCKRRRKKKKSSKQENVKAEQVQGGDGVDTAGVSLEYWSAAHETRVLSWEEDRWSQKVISQFIESTKALFYFKGIQCLFVVVPAAGQIAHW